MTKKSPRDRFDALAADIRQVSGSEALKPIAQSELLHAEQRLGIPLPQSYRWFSTEFGAWSLGGVELFPPGALEWEDREDALGRPAALLAFATDGGGNDWCFDTRVALPRGYAIAFWDHEEGPAQDELPSPDSDPSRDVFLSWLEDQLAEASARAEEEWTDRWTLELDQVMEAQVTMGARGYAPSPEEIAEAEAALGARYPKQYAWFVNRYGPWQWPVALVSPLFAAEERARMRDALGRPDLRALPLCQHADGGWAAFLPGAEGVYQLSSAGERRVAPSFLPWLRARIQERRTADASRPRPSAKPPLVRKRS